MKELCRACAGCVVEPAAYICSIFLVKRAPNTQEVVYNHLAPVAYVGHPRAVKSEEEADAEAKYKCWSSAEKCYVWRGVENETYWFTNPILWNKAQLANISKLLL